ncbi:hypothetical protein CLIM01_14865 [Colletotrichum limetticola]|uniref:Uncharacterized protein n=1 Tax=Colletotrichum limetticola TaxID=1209924 RepID=A0ABQ9P6M8_9PEZI|nr:hypothetical protein CLIM01_14865 [Colletotrichum limetticola]
MNPPHPGPCPFPHCATDDANAVTSCHKVTKWERCLRRDTHLNSPKDSKRHPQVFVLAGHPAALGVERKIAPGTGQVQAHRLDVSHPIPTRLPGRNSNFARTCSSSEDEEGDPAFTTALMYPSTPADGSSTIRFRPGVRRCRCTPAKYKAFYHHSYSRPCLVRSRRPG